jgi:hypothetical protein
VADTVDSIAAGLESDPETTELAGTWTDITAKADVMSAARRKLNREASRARVRLTVRDGLWDRTVAAFGRAAVDASGGRRDQAPYTRFFAKVTPSKAQTFGIEREIELGRSWEVELGRHPDEPLAVTWIPRLKDATDTLETAFKARNAAVTALGPQQTSTILFIDDVNRELDRLEGDLKKLFAGQPDRVADFLAATRPNRPAQTDETPTPAATAQ